MATPLISESLQSTKSQDRLTILGFIYTVNIFSLDLKYICEKL